MIDKILAIIPAYNEQANLERTLTPFLAPDCPYDYIVVNDGSADGTRRLCEKNGWRFIDLPVNVGLTYAVKTGMLYAYEKGYTCAVQFDADGQHDFACIAALAEAVRGGDYDIAVGTRYLTKKAPLSMRGLGSRFLALLIRMSAGQRLTDPTSGMRMYNRRMIELYARRSNMNPEPDTISYLIRCGVRVKEVQVDMHDRTEGESKFSPGASVDYMVKTAFSLVFIQWFRKKELTL